MKYEFAMSIFLFVTNSVVVTLPKST